ncbi:hypothetical protein BP5796_09175 [Coleophoma crateriformis]|uniref:SWIM-type domain-containing protein n=1 Tax=Coleophoma crateriformis TaxID=565419 RepID=A0A3D8R3J1_9HELO|nr:hypothetical protein BP5796_09175 [Coleophoma crateriformis]
MSAPTSSFSKLSLDPNMQRAEARNYPDSEESSDDDTSDDECFALAYCKEFRRDDEGGDFFAFQVVFADIQPYGVRIYQNKPRPECPRCENPEDCPHIEWLMEQIGRTRRSGATGGPYQHIDELGLRTICDELHWEMRTEDDSDAPSTKWELKKRHRAPAKGIRTSRISQARKTDVRNIMATLSPVTAQQYRADIFDEDIIIYETLVPRDLEATICRLLLLDDDVYYQFKDLVPKDAQVLDFLHKMQAKAVESFQLLDRYIQSGPIPGQVSHDVPWCANALIEVVNSVAALTFTPISRAAKMETVRILTSILEEVVERNYDIYASITWTRRPIPHEKDIDRNLYKLLIGSSSRDNPAQGDFVLGALHGVRDAAGGAIDDLDEIATKIGSLGFGAPAAYMNKLKGLIEQLKSGSRLGIAAGKRLSEGSDRQSKRMK